MNPETKGTPPEGRYQHSISYFQPYNVLIIYGGRNEKKVFHDLIILRLENLEWLKVSVFGHIPGMRFGHCTSVVNDKLFIFGGVNIQGYLPSSFAILELDQTNAKASSNVSELRRNDAIKGTLVSGIAKSWKLTKFKPRPKRKFYW